MTKKTSNIVTKWPQQKLEMHVISMTTEDWAKRIDAYLSNIKRPLLDSAESVSRKEAVLHAETEFERSVRADLQSWAVERMQILPNGERETQPEFTRARI